MVMYLKNAIMAKMSVQSEHNRTFRKMHNNIMQAQENKNDLHFEESE